MSAVEQLDKFQTDEYKERYETQFKTELLWLEQSAKARSDAIQYLLSKNLLIPESVLDLGCGTGSLLRELQKRKVGVSYTAIDYSEDALEYLRNNSEGIETIKADLNVDKIHSDKSYDLTLLIHVLQHLKKPDQFLKSVLEQVDFSYLIIEAPLEKLMLNELPRLLNWRGKNPAGSMSFFSKKSLVQLVESNGLEIIASYRYAPVYSLETVQLLKDRYDLSDSQYAKKKISSHYLPKYLGWIKKYLHYAHYSLLCRRK
jgi:2-polyprenyl-3-methyl-5-hydroxy-6-metoxy-1,4-benzoquinol methylase